MNNLKLLIITLAIVVGSIIVMSENIVDAIPNANIGIAPTNALSTINVQTSPPSNPAQALSDTLVEADLYNQKIYFVSDGSVIFNVTNAFNSTHAIGP